jgi:hypothetical protein
MTTLSQTAGLLFQRFAKPVAICISLAIIATTIAVPTVLRSPKPANEAAALEKLHRVNTAEVTYIQSVGQYGSLAQLVETGLLDRSFLQSDKGYVLSITVGSGDYRVMATPVSDATGRYEYYSASDDIIRFSSNEIKAPLGQAGTPVF